MRLFSKQITLLILLLVVQLPVLSQNIQWSTMDEALEAQKTNPKKLVVYFFLDNAVDHANHLKTTFTHKDLIAFINENFYIVKIEVTKEEPFTYKGKAYSNPNHKGDIEGQHQFPRALKINKFPTFVLFDDHANYKRYFSHYQSAENLLSKLAMFKHGF